MDLNEVNLIVQNAMLNSGQFPYRTGQLRNNFFSNAQYEGNMLVVPILEKEFVQYGKILQERASIRYRTKNHIIRHKNRHFRYIDKIIEQDVISVIESELGVKYENK